MDDRALMELLHSAPEQGIREAISKYENLLTAIASRILRRRQDVEECVADTFVELWKRAGGMDPQKGSLKGYLICTVRSRAINQHWKQKRDRAVPGTDDLILLASEDEMENQVFLKEDTDVLLELLEELGEPDREIMLRKHFLFEPVKEIAERLGLVPNQVKYKLQSNKCRLRDALEKRGIAL